MRDKVTFFSLILNCCLLGVVIFQNASSKKFKPKKSIVQIEYHNLQSQMTHYLSYDFVQLILELNNDTHIEEGIKVQDIALSILIEKFDFDYKRFFTNANKILIDFIDPMTQEKFKMPFIKNIQKEEYQILLQCGLKEKYPFTVKGLFNQIKQKRAFYFLENRSQEANTQVKVDQKGESNLDPDLLLAFFSTKEFTFFHSLMQFPFDSFGQMECLDMLLEVDFSLLKDLYKTYCTQPAQDLFIQIGISLCMEGNSMLAANKLIEKEFEFIVKRFTDSQLLHLMRLFSKNTPYLLSFIQKMLVSNRSKSIHLSAAILLFRYLDLELPKPIQVDEILEKARQILDEKVHA